MAKRVHAIHSRKDLERWEARSTRRLKFIFLSFLIGFGCSYLFAFTLSIVHILKDDGPLTLNALKLALFSSLAVGACFTPLILLPCIILVTGGVSKYKQLHVQLSKDSRVCSSCGVVALFDDKYVNPSKQKGHTAADLVPHMNVIEEDGKANVLCDKCLAEVSGMDSSETGRVS